MPQLDFRMTQGTFALDVKLDAATGGVLALFGRSGAGKTTIVRAIAGLVRPTSGSIKIAGRTLFDAAAGIDVPTTKRRIGYVFQDARLFPHLRVAANLRYGLARAGDRNSKGIEFDAVVELLGLRDLLARPPFGLSGGERQRVAIGRALLAQPDILLLDEPLASLDAPRKAELLPYLEALNLRTNVPIVYVSHALDEVVRLADTLAIVDGGRIAAHGAVADVMSRLDLRPLVGRFEAGAAIDTTLLRHDTAYALSYLAFGGSEIAVPQIDAEPGAFVRVRIRARDVLLATKRLEGLSARNILAGHIVDLIPETGAYAELAVLVGGQRLVARITRAALDALDLALGSPVFAVVKAVAIERIVRLRDSPGRNAG
jgi:molybdate transport system ATP-binding protein